MYLKIYFNDKPLFLCDAIDRDIEPLLHHDDAVFIDELNGHTVKTMIHEMGSDKVHAGVFLHPNLAELRDAFSKKFTLVTAAGGLVRNDPGDCLLIFRKGNWDLPKGKQDPGESIADCALREVTEETGLSGIRLGTHIGNTYHTYHEGTHFILKESWWFDMRVSGSQEPVPQSEEGITEIRWVTPAKLTDYYGETYPSVRDLLQRVFG
jgi:8-oxo-dGTP pyrophosphatase MutT (NUDIX family)